MRPIRVLVVRHGETEENKARMYQGQLDTRLNAEGRRQAAAVAGALADVPFVAAFSSDLSRAVEVRVSPRFRVLCGSGGFLLMGRRGLCALQTAEAILQRHPGVELVKDVALREKVSCTPSSEAVWG
jgi:probable phosphoglycerate mutase